MITAKNTTTSEPQVPVPDMKRLLAPMQAFRPLAAVLACTSLVWSANAADQPSHSSPEGASLTVYADRAYTAPGTVVENAAVRIENGKIVAIAPGVEPPGEDSLQAAAMTAGMIDLSAKMHGGSRSVEQLTEVQPQRRVATALDLFDPAWKLQLESGVTTVMSTPDDRNVIGGLTVVLKTGGEPNLEARLVKADACVRGAIGTAPSLFNSPARGTPTDFFARRPTTRMGVEWEWRKAFYDAEASQRIPEKAFPGCEILLEVLAGKLPLNIETWATQDIRTAVFLREEMQREGFGEIRLILDSAAEAWKEPDLLVRSGAAVVLPPFPESGRTGRANDSAFMAWDVAHQLTELGIKVALSAHGSRDAAQRLAVQGMWARRGGLSLDEALASVTTNPAEMVGVSDRVGSIAVGKDADIVLWSGTPFEATSAVVGVVLGGEVAKDPRP